MTSSCGWSRSFFDIELPGKPTDTVSRWILGYTARIPSQDEGLSLDGLEIQVKNASERRIRQVMLKRAPRGARAEGSPA